MNKIKLIINVVDQVIAVALLIKDAAELRRKEIENKSNQAETNKSEEMNEE